MTKHKQQVQELFGEHHKSVLAHLAGVDKRTVQRWCAGTLEVPGWVVDNINKTRDIWGEVKEKL